MRIPFTFPISVAALTLLSGCDPDERPPLTLGHLAPRSTALAAEADGVALAVEQINADEGERPQQRRLVMIHAETGDDPGQYQAQAVRLAEINDVIALFGAPLPEQSARFARAARGSEVIAVGTGGAGDRPDNVHFYPVGLAPEERGRVLAEYLSTEREAKSAALLIEGRGEAVDPFPARFRTEFRSLGGTTIDFSIGEGGADFDPERVAAAAPDAVVILAGPVEATRIKQALEIEATFVFASDERYVPELLARPNESAGFVFLGAFSSEDDSERSVAFAEAFRAASDREPDAAAALGYDAVKVYAQALREASELSNAKIRERFEKGEPFAVLSGELRFTKNRSPRRAVFVNEIRDGRTKRLKRYDPAVATE